VPDRAIILTGLVAVVVALFGTLEAIVAAASFTILFYYGVANLAAWRMRPADKLYPDWVPLLGLITCGVLALMLPWQAIVSGLGLLAAGALWRTLWRWLYHKSAAPR
jgi:APA family basic amino acid/polyamine antiporter